MARYIDVEVLTERLRLQFCKDCNNYNEIRCRSCDIDDTIDFIEDTPTADVVEVKHGEWVGGEFNAYSGEYEEQCSNCKKYSREYARPYCPNCGAKMDGGAK